MRPYADEGGDIVQFGFAEVMADVVDALGERAVQGHPLCGAVDEAGRNHFVEATSPQNTSGLRPRRSGSPASVPGRQ